MPRLKIESTERDCVFTANWLFIKEEFQKEKKEVLLNIQKEKKINGFRPGNAPLSIIEKKFQPQIEEKIVMTLANSNMSRVEKESLNGLYQVLELSSFNFTEEGLNFSVKFETQPIVKFEKIKVQVLEHIPKITEDDVNEELNKIQRRYIETLDFSNQEEKVVTDKAFVVVDVEVLRNNIPEEKPIKGLSTVIGSKSLFLKDPHTSEEVELLLLKNKSTIGDEIRYQPQIPRADKEKDPHKEEDSHKEKDSHKEEDSHKEKDSHKENIELIITITDIKKTVLPEITDEFVVKYAGEQKISTVTQLKERLKDNLKANFSFYNIKEEIHTFMKKILDSSSVQILIPQGYYKKEFGFSYEDLQKLNEKESSGMHSYIKQQVLQNYMVTQGMKIINKPYDVIFQEYMNIHFASEDVEYYVQELSDLQNKKINKDDPRYKVVEDRMQAVYNFMILSFIKNKSWTKKGNSLSYKALLENYKVQHENNK